MITLRQSFSAPIERRQAGQAFSSAALLGELKPQALSRTRTKACALDHDPRRLLASYTNRLPFHAGIRLLKSAFHFKVVPIIELFSIEDVICDLRLTMKAGSNVNLVSDMHGAKNVLRAVGFHFLLLFGWCMFDIVLRNQTMSRGILKIISEANK